MDEWQNRMEQKIDRLSDAVIQLARMEERMITLFNRMDAYDKQHEKLDERVSDLETTSTERGTTLDTAGRAFWLIVGAAISFILWMVQKNVS